MLYVYAENVLLAESEGDAQLLYASLCGININV